MAVEAVNVAKLQEIIKREPKSCGTQEVAPGVWVRLECHHYTPVTRAKEATSARKRRAIQAHRTYINARDFSQMTKAITINPALRAAIIAKRGGSTPPAPSSSGSAAPPTPPSGGEQAGPAPTESSTKVEGDTAPAAVDHRSNSTEGPVKNQGAVGACTAFSLSTAIDNALRRAGKQETASPSHVWSFYGVPQMSVAGDETLGKSIASVTTWGVKGSELCKLLRPNPWGDDCESAYGVRLGTWQTDADIQAKLKASNASATFKVQSIKKLQTLPADMDELTSALASGYSLWIAMKIDGSRWTNSKMATGAVIPDWTFPSGGHAVVMSGYRTTPGGKQFLIHTSWGESWGDKGYAWVSAAMVTKFMHYAYKVSLAGDAPPPPPPGTNPPPGKVKPPVLVLTDDDCDADELIDVGAGTCAQICEDDSRRFNGQCLTIGGGAGKK